MPATVNFISVAQPAVWNNAAGIGHAELDPARWQIVQQEQVILMRTFNLHAQRIAKFCSASRMIDMAMGKQYLLNLHIGLFDGLENSRHIATGIHDSATLVFFIENQRTVLLEGRDGDDKNFEFSHDGAA